MDDRQITATLGQMASAHQAAAALTKLRGVPLPLRYRLALLAERLRPAHEQVVQSEAEIVERYARRGEDGALLPLQAPGPDGTLVDVPNTYQVAPEHQAEHQAARAELRRQMATADELTLRPLDLYAHLEKASIDDEATLGECFLALGPFLTL